MRVRPAGGNLPKGAKSTALDGAWWRQNFGDQPTMVQDPKKPFHGSEWLMDSKNLKSEFKTSSQISRHSLKKKVFLDGGV